jgi:DNA-damage-inducible protein J
MATTTMVHIRLDETLKTQAADTLAAMGLSLSDAVRVFLTRVVAEQRLPFELKAPNAETRAALAEAEAIIDARHARFARAEALFDALDQETRQR